MSAQTPVPKDHPLMVAWQAHKATEQHANDVRWAKVEAHTDGALWSAFEAGWRAREAAITAAGWVVEQGWQPIETAPRDGTPLLLWFPLVSGGQPSGMRHGRWNGKNDMFPWDCGAWSCQADAVTHWRPLPAAPQEDKR